MIGQWSPVLYALAEDETDEKPMMEEFRSQLLKNAGEGVRLLQLSLQTSRQGEQPVCRYFTPLVTFCSLHICDAIAHWSCNEQEQIAAVFLCCEILDRNRAGFKLCGPLMQMFRTAVAEYSGFDISDELDQRYGGRDQYSMDEILDASTRLTYTIPVAQLTRWLDPEFETQWPGEWAKQMGNARRRPSAVGHSMRLGDVLN